MNKDVYLFLVRLKVNFKPGEVRKEHFQQEYQVTAVMVIDGCGDSFVDISDKRAKCEDDSDKDPPTGTHFTHLNLTSN